MPRLQTSYMNLKLRNPVIAGSSGMTKNADRIAACEDAGAGAVVIKSLFEEVLSGQDWGLEPDITSHAELSDYYSSRIDLLYGAREYCDIITQSKKRTSIPVIASINCVSSKWWAAFASQLESAGADAIELNVFKIATDKSLPGTEIEKLYFEILQSVKEKVKIPVSMKIGSQFTSLTNFTTRLCNLGLNGLVMFNRFTEPEIDINNLKLKTRFAFTKKEDIYLPLRWAAILSGYLDCDICASTGIKTSEDVIKFLLAGCTAVQIASLFYQEGLNNIGSILEGIEKWMLYHGFETLQDFKGKLNFASTGAAEEFLRSQFMDKISGID